MDNKRFNELKQSHPEWSDEQIWTAISLEMEAENVIEKRGKDINPEDPDLITQILIGAKKWLEEVLPTIYQKVEDFFKKIISTIGDWIRKGFDYLNELIDRWL